MVRARRQAWVNRVASLCACAVTLLAARAWEPDARERAELLYTVVLGLGYGHLIGAALPGMRGRARVSGGLVLASGFCAYTGLVHHAPEALLLLLAVSVWHSVENELELPRTLARCHGAAPFSRAPAAQLLPVALTILVGALFVEAGADAELGLAPPAGAADRAEGLRSAAVAMALVAAVAAPEHRMAATGTIAAAAFLPRGGVGVSFPELFAASVLYHLLSWMGVVALRGGTRRLLLVHGLPVAFGLVLAAIPGDLARQARAFAFSPVVYLYWSLAHVAQTLRVRLREP